MTIAHLLEDFSAGNAPGDVLTLMSGEALEDQRLASFEKGYSAGWEDAFQAQEQDQARITGDLARSLGDLSFTYHEAMTQLLGSLEPVFFSLVDQVLPDIMTVTIGQHIVEQFCDMARHQVSGAATLIVPVGAGAALAPALAQNLPMPVEISEDPEMVSDHVFLRFGTIEREVDSAALISSIRQAVKAFNYQNSQELKNG